MTEASVAEHPAAAIRPGREPSPAPRSRPKLAPLTPEDEYPNAPTFVYFAMKTALAVLTTLVLALAFYFRPYSCDGICNVEVANRKCGPMAPSALVLYNGGSAFDGEFGELVKISQARKGFNVIAVPDFNVGIKGLTATAALYATINDTLSHLPWQAILRGNHTLYETSSMFVDWQTATGKAVESMVFVRNPRLRLKEWFEHAISAIPEPLFVSRVSMDRSQVTLEKCLADTTCANAMGLRSVCGQQTLTICGEDCLYDNLSEHEKLARAVRNLRNKFQYVGVIEDATASLTLLRRMFPTFFEFLPTTATIQTDLSEFDSTLSSKLDEICWLDDGLYYEAHQLFSQRANECGIASNEAIRRPIKPAQRRFSIW